AKMGKWSNTAGSATNIRRSPGPRGTGRRRRLTAGELSGAIRRIAILDLSQLGHHPLAVGRTSHTRSNMPDAIRVPTTTRVFFAVAVFAALMPAIAFGQAGDTDVGEVSAYAGGSFGAGTHPYVGGSSGFAFSRRGMAFFEGSYTHMSHDILWRRHDIKSPQDS